MFTNYSGILFTYNIECVYRESQLLLTDSSMEATMKFWTWKAKPRTGLWVYHMTWCPKFSLIFTHGSTNMVTKKKTSNYVYFTKLDRFSFSYIPPPLSLSSVQGRFIFNGMALNLNWSLQNHSLSKRYWIIEAELIRRKRLRAIWRGSLAFSIWRWKMDKDEEIGHSSLPCREPESDLLLALKNMFNFLYLSLQQ